MNCKLQDSCLLGALPKLTKSDKVSKILLRTTHFHVKVNGEQKVFYQTVNFKIPTEEFLSPQQEPNMVYVHK
jgi:hypothetical protein